MEMRSGPNGTASGTWWRRQAAMSQTAKPLQELENVKGDKDMNIGELEEFVAASLKAERLEILTILHSAKSLDEAIKAIE
ncbi:MAG: hypothetical protein ACI4P5_10280 [Candidatus Fimadaptatus sp.]